MTRPVFERGDAPPHIPDRRLVRERLGQGVNDHVAGFKIDRDGPRRQRDRIGERGEPGVRLRRRDDAQKLRREFRLNRDRLSRDDEIGLADLDEEPPPIKEYARHEAGRHAFEVENAGAMREPDAERDRGRAKAEEQRLVEIAGKKQPEAGQRQG